MFSIATDLHMKPQDDVLGTLQIELNSATDKLSDFLSPENPGPHEVVSGGNLGG